MGDLERLRRASGSCPAGYYPSRAEVVRRMASRDLGGIHDQGQIEDQSCHPLRRPKDQ